MYEYEPHGCSHTLRFSVMQHYGNTAAGEIFRSGRITGRLLLGVSLGSDDWTMVAAFVTYMAGVGTSLGLVLNEFGEHTFWLSETQIVTALKFFYVAELFYILSNTLTKLSLLLFFLRIFPNKVFLRRVQIFSAFVILSGLALFLAMAFQCVPFHGYWTNWTLPTESPLRTKCINQYAALYVASGLSIFQNFVILILPIPTLWRLELSKGRRANVLVMFSVGSGVIIFSFLRLPSLARLKGSTDLSCKLSPYPPIPMLEVGLRSDVDIGTDDQAPIVIYSHLEQAFGIICACLPACRSLLEYFFPALRLNLSGADEHASNSRHMNQSSSVAGGKSVLRRSRRNTSSRALVELTDRNEVDGGECGDKEVSMLEMLRGVKRGMSKSSVAISETAVGTDVDEERDRVLDDEKGSRARRSSGKGSKMMNTWEPDGHGVIVMTMTVEQSNQSVEDVRAARAHMHAREGSDCSIGKAS
ncbi:uncharacterized protein PAC_15956 [Phialocephala subalpina]|uniref:Rhodopsin domain-containing protein n=1 Tax=Phialocephala subalpina TaxID=576137 RepID=A0A1L7XLX7_9HELO|nr:uncharacterized protein PAC_15956 [Phialocephala subalpina]